MGNMATPEFHPPRRRNDAWCPESGKMYWFQQNCVRVFAPGEARCWIKWQGQPQWRGHIPDRVPNPYLRSVGKWLDLRQRHGKPPKGMTARVRRRWATFEWVDRFPEDYSRELSVVSDDCFWGALSILSRVPEGRELFHDNAAWTLLAYYGWDLFPDLQVPSRRFRGIRDLLGRRKRKLLGRLGFPEKEWVVRLLRKLPTRELTLEDLRAFRRIMLSDAGYAERFRHLPVIEMSLLRLVDQVLQLEGEGVQARIPIELILGISSTQKRGEVVGLLEDTLRMEAELRTWEHLDRLPLLVRQGLAHPRTFQRFDALKDWHDDLQFCWHERGRDEVVGLEFEASPIPSTTLETRDGPVQIRNLASSWDIHQHARTQHNCMAHLDGMAARGQCLLYEVESDFAPLHSLRLNPGDGHWILGELKGPCNQPPHPKISRHLHLWVERHQDVSAPETDRLVI